MQLTQKISCMAEAASKGCRILVTDPCASELRLIDLEDIAVIIAEDADHLRVLDDGEILQPLAASDLPLLRRGGQHGSVRRGCREYTRVLGTAQSSDSPIHGRLSPSIQRALGYIEKTYSEPEISLDRAAGVAFMSRSHFCRRFKREVGITYGSYLAGLRIERAQELLFDIDLSVTQICFDVGYSDLSHFERVFKRTVGTTPSRFRARFAGQHGSLEIDSARPFEYWSLPRGQYSAYRATTVATPDQ